MRVIALAAGLVLGAALAPAYLRRASAFSAVLVTVGGAFLSTATVIRLSGLPWRSWGSLSQAGGAEKPSAWLLTTAALCFGLGLLATGRLVVRDGSETGQLRQRGRTIASTLPVVAFAGFVVVGVCQVGGIRGLSLAHNVAAWAAMSAFWVGMLATPSLPGVSRALRSYSAIAAVVVFVAWLPSGLHFLGIVETLPISTLYMELLVFPLCLVWLGWLGWAWGEQGRDSGTAAQRTAAKARLGPRRSRTSRRQWGP